MMAADYILIFRGSNIEAGRIIYDLKEIGIQPITKDQPLRQDQDLLFQLWAMRFKFWCIKMNTNGRKKCFKMRTSFLATLLPFHLTCTRQKSYNDQ